MEEFINNFQDLSPFKLQANLSTRYYEYARQANVCLCVFPL